MQQGIAREPHTLKQRSNRGAEGRGYRGAQHNCSAVPPLHAEEEEEEEGRGPSSTSTVHLWKEPMG